MRTPWTFRVFIFVLVLLVGLTGYNYFVRPFAQVPIVPATLPDIPKDIVTLPDPAQEADEALASMSAAAKVGLLFAAPIDLDISATNSARLKTLERIQPGMLTLFGSGVSARSVETFLGAYTPDRAPVIAVDHEGGRVQRLSGSGFTQLPSWQELCELEDADKRKTLLELSARELQAAGVGIVFAPMLDVASNNPILGDRICSPDQELTAARALEFAQVFAQHGIASTYKHFPGIGATTKDTHLAFDTVTLSLEDTQVFRSVLKQQPKSAVMVAHVGVTNQDDSIPCSLSKDCVGQLLELYPQALPISDALDMRAAQYDAVAPNTPQALADASVKALEAGIAVLVYGNITTLNDIEVAYEILLDRYVQDAQFAAIVDARARTVLQFFPSHY